MKGKAGLVGEKKKAEKRRAKKHIFAMIELTAGRTVRTRGVGCSCGWMLGPIKNNVKTSQKERNKTGTSTHTHTQPNLKKEKKTRTTSTHTSEGEIKPEPRHTHTQNHI